MAVSDLGSIALGFELDLRNLKKQANEASGVLDGLQRKTQQAATPSGQAARSGGFFSSLIGGAAGASTALSSLGNQNGVFSRITQAAGGMRAVFAGVAATAGGTAAALTGVGAAIAAAALIIGGAILTVKGLQAAFQQLGGAIQNAVTQQSLETSFQVMAQNMGISSREAESFKNTLRDYNITGAAATRIMQNMLNAQLPLNKSTKALVDVGQRYAVVAGTDTPTAINTITDAIATLNPQLLRQFGIVSTLPQIYEKYADANGLTASALTETQQRQAILNTVLESGARLQGAQNAAQFDAARGFSILKANIDEVKTALGRVALPIFTGLLKTLVPISRDLAGNSENLGQKMESLGQRIAGVVVPAVGRFISFVRSIPWVGIIDGLYRTIKLFQLLSAPMILAAQTVLNFAKAAIRAFGVVISGVRAVINAFVNVGRVAVAAWNAITGKGSISDLGAAIKNVATTAIEDMGNTLTQVGNLAGGLVVDQFNDTVAAINRISGAAAGIAKGFNIKEFFDSLPTQAAKGWKSAGKTTADEVGGMSKEAMKALKKMREELEKENADFARSQAKAAKDFKNSLAELTAQHRDQIKDIRKDIQKESADFKKAQEERTRDYQQELNNLNKADTDRKNDVQKQLAEEIAKGRFADQTKIASLRSRLAYEDAAHKEAVDKATENYNKETEKAKTANSERLADLQTNLNAELAIKQKHAADFARFRDFQIKDDITKLKEQYAAQKKEDQRAHSERLADIIKRGKEELAQHTNNGAANANGYMDALGGGMASKLPEVKTKARNVGKDTQNSTAQGMGDRQEHVSSKFKGVLGIAADAGRNIIGKIFGPVGLLAADWVGRKIRDSDSTIGSALRAMWRGGVNLMGSLWEYGAKIVRELGKSIASALGSVAGGAFRRGWNAIGLPAFASGGIVQGASGEDSIIARVSKGEMILNKDQQARLFNFINGSNSDLPQTRSGSSMTIENLNISLPAVQNADDFTRELQLKFATLRTT
jgi:hypothetical protein